MGGAAACPPSLSRRMIAGVVALLGGLGLLAVLAEPLLADRVSLPEWFAREEVRPMLAASIHRDAAGTLFLDPSPELRTYMDDNPGFWFFATDGVWKIEGGAAPSLELWHGAKAEPQGTTFLLRAKAGRVGVLLGGYQGSPWAGVRAWLLDRLQRWLGLLVGLAVCTTLVTVRLVHFLLRPIQHAAQAAAALRPGQKLQALPEAGVPAEILPLVTATNAAFRRLEEEHERQRRFIANAAHELRTPIAILGVRLDELPECPTKLALLRDVKRLTVLADQLLDVQRMQLSEREERRPLDLVSLCREVVAEMGPLAIGLGSTLAFDTALPVLVRSADERALRGVFLNLVNNALTHGGPQVAVEVRVNADGTIDVVDDGGGIAAESRDRVFEAFQRGSGGGGGAGLGLYIVREVLRTHGATIALRDGRHGTAFRVSFPEEHGNADAGPWQTARPDDQNR